MCVQQPIKYLAAFSDTVYERNISIPSKKIRRSNAHTAFGEHFQDSNSDFNTNDTHLSTACYPFYTHKNGSLIQHSYNKEPLNNNGNGSSIERHQLKRYVSKVYKIKAFRQ